MNGRSPVFNDEHRVGEVLMKLKVCVAGGTGWVGKPLCMAIAQTEDLTLVGGGLAESQRSESGWGTRLVRSFVMHHRQALVELSSGRYHHPTRAAREGTPVSSRFCIECHRPR